MTNPLIIIGILGVVLFLSQSQVIQELTLLSASQLTGSNVVPKNIAFTKDNIIYLDSDILELELFDTSNPSCGGSSLSIIQEDIQINNQGYKCSGLPASTCRGTQCGGQSNICLNKNNDFNINK